MVELISVHRVDHAHLVGDTVEEARAKRAKLDSLVHYESAIASLSITLGCDASAFDPDGPDRLWCMDITEPPTTNGKVYLAVVIDAWSRRVVGWSIADHIRAELVADAVQMATWKRQPRKAR